MKKLILCSILFSRFLLADGQSKDSIKVDSTGLCSQEVFFAEYVPKYPDGDKEFINAVIQKLSFNSGVNGIVRLSFVVNCIGKPVRFKFVKGINDSVNEKFIAAVKSLKDWIPGSQNGKVIDVAVAIGFEVKNGVVSQLKSNQK